MRRALSIALLVLVGLGCEFAGARINVYNGSGEMLSDIELTGSGFHTTIDSLAAGEVASVRVEPDGESALSVAFTSGGVRHEVEEKGAFHGEAHYQIRVEIRPDLTIAVREFLN
jgi:hypothetical protein